MSMYLLIANIIMEVDNIQSVVIQIKTVSPKRVVTIDNSYAHFLTISGHFFANHINIFHKTEVQWSFWSVLLQRYQCGWRKNDQKWS